MDSAPSVVTITLNPALDDSFSVPRLVPGRKIRCSTPRIDPGGGGINVARVLNVLMVPTMAVFPVAGHIGQALADLLEAEQVPADRIEVVGETRLSHHVRDLETGLEYRFVPPGSELCETDLERCLQAVRRHGREASYLVLSGSLPPGVGPDVVATVRLLADDLGARLVLDTAGEALSWAHGAYLIKPSVRELEDHLGQRLDTVEDQLAGARELLLTTRAGVVVLSRGHQGLALVTQSGTQLLPALTGDLVSGVGAGDALVAGILGGMVRGWELTRSARLGLACSASMIQTAGTSVFTRDDLAAHTGDLPYAPPPRLRSG